jgi:23S rRNA pseudouridine1911/1915/1917 synthase
VTTLEDPDGMRSITLVKVAERLPGATLLEVTIKTGRTHQIRVHASYAGFPVVGDKIYGPSEACYLEFIETGWTHALEKRLILKRHALHSAGIKFEWSSLPMEWKTGWPEDLKNFAGNLDMVS